MERKCVIVITRFSRKFAQSFERPSVSVTLGHFTNALRETAHSGLWAYDVEILNTDPLRSEHPLLQ
jgi:hypothetical protein